MSLFFRNKCILCSSKAFYCCICNFQQILFIMFSPPKGASGRPALASLWLTVLLLLSLTYFLNLTDGFATSRQPSWLQGNHLCPTAAPAGAAASSLTTACATASGSRRHLTLPTAPFSSSSSSSSRRASASQLRAEGDATGGNGAPILLVSASTHLWCMRFICL